MSRLSGPLLDRIDIHVDVPALTYEQISDSKPSGPTSAEVRAQVQAAREIQHRRYNHDATSNAKVDATTMRKHCKLDKDGNTLLQRALDHLGLSARAYDKILRVSRTLADLESLEDITPQHIAEAIQYRSLDRELF